MPGDYTRRTFQPLRDAAGIYEQQGRVRLDANLNELVDLLDRRLRATSYDTLGRAVVPATTPDGFAITIGAAGVEIGPGRAYVDGILVDNHGRSRDGLVTPAYDPALEEVRGTGTIPIERQPYVPDGPPWAPAIPTTGVHLAYLDVWHRERTWAEDPSLLDPALYGIDTATRRQTVWQVKLHDLQGDSSVTCDTPDGQVPGWADIVRPSAARLSTQAIGVPAVSDPCAVPPAGGYRGVENRLYRIEILDGGGFGTATFLMSRDDASLASPVTVVNGAELTVVRPGRDEVLRFATGDWVEVTDDDRELLGEPGELAKVQSVDDTRGVVTLTAALGGPFNVANPSAVSTRIRRWDLPAGSATALQSVTAAPIVLEDGIQVTFSLDAAIAGGAFRTGEAWVFAVRTADGSVEQLVQAPPITPIHHIVRLAVLDLDAGTVNDCRTHWPVACGDCGCECDACVTPESHNNGAFTIADAVAQVSGTGGTVCLAVGVYVLRDSVGIVGAGSVRIRGKGWRTIVLTPGPRPAFVVLNSIGVTIEDLTVLGVERRPDGDDRDGAGLALGNLDGEIAIGVANSVAITIQRCVLVTNPGRRDRQPTVATLGVVAALTVRENWIVGTIGIGNVLGSTKVGASLDGEREKRLHVSSAAHAPAAMGVARAPGTTNRELYQSGRLLLAHWSVVDNVIVAGRAGIALLGAVVSIGDNRFDRNDIAALFDAGIAIAAIQFLGPLEIDDNVIASGGFGIVCGADMAAIEENVVIGFPIGRLGGIGEVITKTTTDTTIYPGHICGDDVTVTTIVDTPIYQPLGPVGVGYRAGIIVLDPLGLGARLRMVRIGRNDVAGVKGLGIAVVTPVRRSDIDSNRVSDIVAGGIVAVTGRGESVVISDNLVERIRGLNLDDRQRASLVGTGSVGLGVGLAGISVFGTRTADVRDNMVASIATSGNRATGIALGAVRSGRVVSNRVGQVGDDPAFAVGILVDGPFGNAEVIDNEVVTAVQREGFWIAILIQGADLRERELAAPPLVGRHVEDERVWIHGRGFEPIDVGGELAAVRGNTVGGFGRMPAILVGIQGNVVANDNRARHMGGETAFGAVLLISTTAVINANYVEVQREGVAIRGTADPSAVATTGNVTNGRILMGPGGAPLGPPWNAINVSV